MDGPSLTQTDILSILRTIKYAQASGFTGLYRYQFIELFIRVAVKKYGYQENTETLDALSMMINRHFIRYAWPKNSQDFRTTHLYDEKLDFVLHQHLSTILDLFHLHTSSEINSEINLENFRRLFGCYTSNFDVIKYCFVASKETHIVDDLFADRLRFVEFLEAFVRVIDRIRLHAKSKNEILYRVLDRDIDFHFKKMVSVD